MILEAVFDCLSVGMIVPLLASLTNHGSTGFPAADALLGSFPRRERVLLTVGVIFALFLSKNLVRYVSGRVQSVFLWQLRSHWWESIMAGYLAAPYRFFTSTDQGKVLSDLVNEPSYCMKGLLSILKLIASVLVSLAYYAAMLAFSWQATLALTVVGALLALPLRRWINRRAHELGQVRQSTYHRVTHQAAEAVQGILQIKLYELEPSVRGRFAATVRELNRSISEFETLRNLPGPLLETALVGFLVAALALLGDLTPSLPILGGLALLGQKLFGQVSILAGGTAEWVTTIPAIRRTAELVSDALPREGRTAGKPFEALRREVVFRDVRFAYPGKTPVLRGLSFTLQAGQVVVLDGASGSGKSTVVGLLGGIHEGYDGEILVDGVELRDLDLRSWRRRLAFLSQDNFLFSGTLRDNVLLGRPGASEADVLDALRRAGLSDLAPRLDSAPGDRGLELSGGQRQRLVLARGLLRDPDVLILDEASNAVDRATELEIQRLVLSWCRERRRTAIIISHSPTWAEQADIVLRLDDGRILQGATR